MGPTRTLDAFGVSLSAWTIHLLGADYVQITPPPYVGIRWPGIRTVLCSNTLCGGWHVRSLFHIICSWHVEPLLPYTVKADTQALDEGSVRRQYRYAWACSRRSSHSKQVLLASNITDAGICLASCS